MLLCKLRKVAQNYIIQNCAFRAREPIGEILPRILILLFPCRLLLQSVPSRERYNDSREFRKDNYSFNKM